MERFVYSGMPEVAARLEHEPGQGLRALSRPFCLRYAFDRSRRVRVRVLEVGAMLGGYMRCDRPVVSDTGHGLGCRR